MSTDPNEIRMDDLRPWRPPERSQALAHYPASDKVLPLGEALRRFVPDGSTVALGTCLEQMIPFAAAHELHGQAELTFAPAGLRAEIAFPLG